MGRAPVVLITFLASFAAPAAAVSQQSLPSGFVRLSDIAPGIRQDIRYARAFNFMGQIVPGYDAPQCILWHQAAQALVQAQAKLASDGLALKVYDCYRPIRAVKAFATWSKAPGGDMMKAIFFPDLDKSKLFTLGYISAHSRHSIGIAVDVGLVRADEANDFAPDVGGRCDGPFERRAKESTLDMGTAYDCFSARAATENRWISEQARINRVRLRHALEAVGFRNYSREWWHFEFTGPSAPAVSHDFLVQ